MCQRLRRLAPNLWHTDFFSSSIKGHCHPSVRLLVIESFVIFLSIIQCTKDMGVASKPLRLCWNSFIQQALRFLTPFKPEYAVVSMCFWMQKQHVLVIGCSVELTWHWFSERIRHMQFMHLCVGNRGDLVYCSVSDYFSTIWVPKMAFVFIWLWLGNIFPYRQYSLDGMLLHRSQCRKVISLSSMLVKVMLFFHVINIFLNRASYHG